MAKSILSTVVSTLGITSIFTYFSGWIYHWSYFNFFNIRVGTLNLPQETFFILPIQIFFGDLTKIFLTSLVIIITIFLIKVTSWLITPEAVSDLSIVLPATSSYSFKNNCIQKIHRFWLFQKIRHWKIITPSSPIYEVIIVAWIIFVIYWFARYQGYMDARLDTFSDTSVKPVVTLVSPKGKLILGRDLHKLLIEETSFENPSLKDIHIIGDKEQFKALWGFEVNDKTVPEQPVWRFLAENNDWIYIYPSLPATSPPNANSPVLAIPKKGGHLQFLILGNPSSR